MKPALSVPHTPPTGGIPIPSLLDKTGVTRQTTFWRKTLLQTADLQAMIRENRPWPRELITFMKCRTEEHEASFVCMSCGTPHTFAFRCDKRFCPACSVNLSCERKDVLEACLHLLKQPKHLVLTARNMLDCRAMLRLVLSGLRKFLRRELCREVRGGWCSVEITNESRGWHVHAHLLVDAPFLDVREIARVWASCVGQSFAIVNINCVCGQCARCRENPRKQSYLAEVTKYTVKPTAFLKWPHADKVEFVRAIRGRRLFFAFGHIAEAARNFRRNRKLYGKRKWACACGLQELESVRSLANPKRLHKQR